jgi:hypothetical protein
MDLVPHDAMSVITMQLGAWWNTGPGQNLVRNLVPIDAASVVENLVGAPPGQIDRVSLVLPEDQPWFYLVSTIIPYDGPRVLSLVAPHAGPFAVEQKKYVDPVSKKAIFFLNNRLYLFGNDASITKHLESLEETREEGPLSRTLGEADQHLLTIGVNPKAAYFLQFQKQSPDLARHLQGFLDSDAAAFTLDVNEVWQINALLFFREGGQTVRASRQIREGFRQGRELLAQWQKNLETPQSDLVGSYRYLVDALFENFHMEPENTRLHFYLGAAADKVGDALRLYAPALHQVRELSARNASATNLRQLVEAMHAYHGEHGCFPPAATYSRDGRPLLSWRVLLLPYLSNGRYRRLYNEFQLDKPWDSPDNLIRMRYMPAVYAPVGDDVKAALDTTYYQVFTGPTTPFPEKGRMTIVGIRDGDANTVLITEAAEPVPWTQPRDIPYDPSKPLPKLGGQFSNGFFAALANQTVRFLPRSLSETTLRAVITPAGRDTVGPDWARDGWRASPQSIRSRSR